MAGPMQQEQPAATVARHDLVAAAAAEAAAAAAAAEAVEAEAVEAEAVEAAERSGRVEKAGEQHRSQAVEG